MNFSKSLFRSSEGRLTALISQLVCPSLLLFDEPGIGLPVTSEVKPIEPPPERPRRDILLRFAIYATILGAALTVVYAFFLANYSEFDSYFGIDPASYHQVIVPLAALFALAGVLILDRQVVAGMIMTVLGTFIALAGGGIYLVPGTALASTWAVNKSRAARMFMGYLLLIPGIVAVFYSMGSLISYVGGTALPGLPEPLMHPATLREALAPALLLPLAIVGAWMLSSRTDTDRDNVRF